MTSLCVLNILGTHKPHLVLIVKIGCDIFALSWYKIPRAMGSEDFLSPSLVHADAARWSSLYVTAQQREIGKTLIANNSRLTFVRRLTNIYRERVARLRCTTIRVGYAATIGVLIDTISIYLSVYPHSKKK